MAMGSSHRLLIALLPALVAGAMPAATAASGAAAMPDDPLQAPDCLNALAALRRRRPTPTRAARAHAASGTHDALAPSAELQAARRLAARSCLANRADPPPARSIQVPIVVAPVASPRPVPAPAARPPTDGARAGRASLCGDGMRSWRLLGQRRLAPEPRRPEPLGRARHLHAARDAAAMPLTWPKVQVGEPALESDAGFTLDATCSASAAPRMRAA